jgi:hypothetical protein
MSRKIELYNSIAEIIADYREGEISKPYPNHVYKWINQFNDSIQVPILEEVNHVLRRTYITKEHVRIFLTSLLNNRNLVKGEPRPFWGSVTFLNIQLGGNSQKDMLAIFDRVLVAQCGLITADCSVPDPNEKIIWRPIRNKYGGFIYKNHCPIFEEISAPLIDRTYIYIDDIIFSGGRVSQDLKEWITHNAPDNITIHIITMANHRSGLIYANNEINKIIGLNNKNVKLMWWSSFDIEDRREYINSSNVLRPTTIPSDYIVQEYYNNLKCIQQLRNIGNACENNFFSCETGRHILEQEFLKAGVRILADCQKLKGYQRPLGNSFHNTLGFGSMMVTFRNCPNNCPLVFWVGHPWYPLFPRKTN